MGIPKGRALSPLWSPSVRVSRTGEILSGNNLGRLRPSCLTHLLPIMLICGDSVVSPGKHTMKNLAAVCAVLIILPFLLGYIHAGSKKGFQSTVLYYRYFVFINVVFSALFVAGRMFLAGPEAAAISGWAYSPVFQLYGIALLSMALMGLFTVLKQERIMLAPAICWSIFLMLSSISHLYQVYFHAIKDVNIILVHVTYNIVVSGILARYIFVISRRFRCQRVAQTEGAAKA